MKHPTCVMGLHPSTRGFGWALFEGPDQPFDAGTADIRQDKNERVLLRIDTLLRRYRPAMVCLEAFDGRASRRSARIRELCRGIVKLTRSRRIRIQICTRTEIAAALGGARTRDGVARTIAERFEAFQPRLPKSRAIWESEHPNMALFSAAACALTAYASRR